MASKEGGSESLQYKTWVLKVSIHCEGCKKKVKRILQNVDGVYHIDIDSHQNKVTVTGNVEAETLMRKLLKSGKHSELWPVEKKPSNTNPSPNPLNSGKEKNKEKERVSGEEKDASKSNEPHEKTEKPPEKSAAADPKPETVTKPAETVSTEQAAAAAETVTTEKAAAAAAKPSETITKPASEASGSSSTETSKPKPEKAPSYEPETKPADTATKNSGSGKKKEKQAAEAVDNEAAARSSGGGPPLHPPWMHQVPPYPQPVYAASYNMAHPTASYSYYAPPMTPMPQSYMYSGHPPPPPEYYPHYPHYPPANYYSPMEPQPSSQSEGSYEFFSDENANSCTVM